MAIHSYTSNNKLFQEKIMKGQLIAIITGTILAVLGTNLPASANSMVAEILAAHNKYRQKVGVPPLTWSEQLAKDAQEWANYLAKQGKFEHSGVKGQGENLWMGTAGYFSYTQMVDGWGSEKRYFVNKTFPDVSSNGNWHDVGHYTQMIWKNTKQVGCATANGSEGTVLVCRYSPPGNFIGQRVY